MKSKDLRRKKLEQIYYNTIPKARRINPVFSGMFDLIFDASMQSKLQDKVLNIFSSRDLSSVREDTFKSEFFNHTNYFSIDFWEDQFVTDQCSELDSEKNNKYSLPYQDELFDTIITTKVVLEHAYQPHCLVSELSRVLKKGGYIYLIAPHIRRQHQAPHDYFRFTEYTIQQMLKSNDFTCIDIKNTGGFMAVIGYYLYFFQRGLSLPRLLVKVFDFVHYWLIEPFFYFLDRLDNGYGRDMTLYFMVKAQKNSL